MSTKSAAARRTLSSRPVAGLIVTLATAFLLGACGGDDELVAATTDEPAVTEETTSTTEETATETTEATEADTSVATTDPKEAADPDSPAGPKIKEKAAEALGRFLPPNVQPASEVSCEVTEEQENRGTKVFRLACTYVAADGSTRSQLFQGADTGGDLAILPVR